MRVRAMQINATAITVDLYACEKTPANRINIRPTCTTPWGRAEWVLALVDPIEGLFISEKKLIFLKKMCFFLGGKGWLATLKIGYLRVTD